MIIGTMRAEEARVFDQDSGFHRFHDEDGNEYGSFEVFWHDGGHLVEPDETDDMPLDDWRDPEPAGWYWRSCFPGCLPDSEPYGPFVTSRDALLDADEYLPEDED